jgi:hypothetical protein
MKMTKLDGTTSDDMTSNWTRVSGGPGFFVTWKSTEVKGAAPGIELALQGPTGITIKVPEAQMSAPAVLTARNTRSRLAGKP